MTSKAATEEALGELHSKVAKVMTNAIDVIDASQEVYLQMVEVAKEDPESLLDIPKPPELSPALMGVMTKFLADNKISCIPEESQETSALATRLKNKQRRSVGNVVHLTNDE